MLNICGLVGLNMLVRAQRTPKCSWTIVLRAFTALIAGTVLSGCAKTPPKDYFELSNAPPNAVATLYLHSSLRRDWGLLIVQALVPVPHKLEHATEVTQIDGRSQTYIPGPTGGRVSEHWPEELRIDAGRRSIQFHYRRDRIIDGCGAGYFGSGCVGYFDKDCAISFNAEGKHFYRVFAYIPDGSHEWIWVKDITIGKVVAGEEPPDET